MKVVAYLGPSCSVHATHTRMVRLLLDEGHDRVFIFLLRWRTVPPIQSHSFLLLLPYNITNGASNFSKGSLLVEDFEIEDFSFPIAEEDSSSVYISAASSACITIPPPFLLLRALCKRNQIIVHEYIVSAIQRQTPDCSLVLFPANP